MCIVLLQGVARVAQRNKKANLTFIILAQEASIQHTKNPGQACKAPSKSPPVGET
jgi:hypothetical protein